MSEAALRRAVSIRSMSVWSIAIGVELALEAEGTPRRIRFWCLDCVLVEDPDGEHPSQAAPYARECMRCTHPRHEIVSVVLPPAGAE